MLLNSPELTHIFVAVRIHLECPIFFVCEFTWNAPNFFWWTTVITHVFVRESTWNDLYFWCCANSPIFLCVLEFSCNNDPYLFDERVHLDWLKYFGVWGHLERSIFWVRESTWNDPFFVRIHLERPIFGVRVHLE